MVSKIKRVLRLSLQIWIKKHFGSSLSLNKSTSTEINRFHLISFSMYMF